jgi:hypothetical protein
MKKLIFIWIAAFFPVFLVAQDTPLSSLYDRYDNRAGFTASEIMPGILSVDQEVSAQLPMIGEMMKDIEKIRVLRYEPGQDIAAQDKFWKKMQKAAAGGGYIEVVSVNSDGEHFSILRMKGATGNTREIALIAKDDDSIMLVTVTGDMDFSEMLSADNMKGLCEMGEHFMHEKGGCSHSE